jgi:hypothetical protein
MKNEFNNNRLFYILILIFCALVNTGVALEIAKLVRKDPQVAHEAPKKHATVCQLVTKSGKEFCIDVE